ncbi:MAG: flagellar basal body-associated FliL family protein [Deltaproteobacteria bacterium]|nr:flagellar basal body-associated FliL family protein [Deltaproteobacteria bacterium]
MEHELKDKDFFEDDNIEDDLSKLEAEIEQSDSTEDDIPSIDDAEPTDKKSEAVELDQAEVVLEEEQEEIEETEAATPESEPEQPPAPVTPWYLNKNIIAAPAIALIIAITFAIYVLMGPRVESDKETQQDPVYPVYYGSFSGKIGPRVFLPDPPLALSPFIVPIDRGTDEAYWFLSISVMSPNSKVYEEIKRKNAFLREGLYNLLIQIVDGGKIDIIPREEIKKEILKSLNKELQTGKINNVFFTNFLLV